MTTSRPECPHCGCNYFIYGNNSDIGLCHDCGRAFELPMEEDECASLRRRAEEKLGWEAGASKSFSFPTLRELVRTKSPKLHYLMGLAISSGKHVTQGVENKNQE